VAHLDAPRAALRLADEELGAAVMLLAAPDHASLAEPGSRAAIERLERAGIVQEGRVEGYPARLLAIVAAPKLRIGVETFVAGAPRLEQAWATEREGVLGSVAPDGEIELSPVEPALIPWAIARWVGLGPREQAHADALALPAEALGAAADHLASGDRDAAAEALEDVDPDTRATVLDVLPERRLSWRATSAWTGEDGEQRVSSTAVLDAGTEGLWLTRHEGEPPADTVHLEPVPPSTVWDRIVGLMPAPEG
jgi:hypothetical protein